MRNINADDFSVIPVCILKDVYKNRIRTPKIEINNIVRPQKKQMLSKVQQKVFSQYHFHEGVEILKIDKGCANVYINDICYKASESDILIINPFECHGIYLTDENAEFTRTCLIFQPADLFPPKKKNNNMLFNSLRSMRFINFISHNEYLSGVLCKCIDDIISLSAQQGADWPIAVFSKLIMFYANCVRGNFLNDKSDCIHYHYEFMSRVTDYIELNISREISTEEVAKHCIYSTEHFCRLFRKCFNRTFKDHLNMCRIQKAKDIIDRGDFERISDIYKAVGFNSPNHFSNIFKKYLNCSPSEYINTSKSKGVLTK